MRFLLSLFAVLLFCQPALAVKTNNQYPSDSDNPGAANTGGRLSVKNNADADTPPIVSMGGRLAAQRYSLTDADKTLLARIEKYLTQVHTISSDFIQSAPNGEISSGKFFLERPGKLRMEYLPPMPVLMVTSGGHIIYYDKELDQITRIPLESTLIGFLARDDVKFDDTVVITNIERLDQMINISLIQSRRPKDGSLTLEFKDSPLALYAMVVRDSAGQVTTVSLNNARFNFPLPEGLFVFKDPHLSGKRSIKN